MAAYQRAEAAYRYYECEGSELCATENAIAGFIEFLQARSMSMLAELAVTRIVTAFDQLAQTQLDPQREYPDLLLGDIASLEAVAPRLSAANRDVLSAPLAATKARLEEIVAARRR
jgi:hypothetical protein